MKIKHADEAVAGSYFKRVSETFDIEVNFPSGEQSSPDSKIQEKLTAPSEFIANSARFGNAVAIDGEVAVVGAPFEDGVATNSGVVYIYRLKSCAKL